MTFRHHYTSDRRYVLGEPVEGEYVLLEDGHPRGVFTNPYFVETLATRLNMLTDRQFRDSLIRQEAAA